MHGTLPRVRKPTAAATEDRFLTRREELENKMAVLLGGRAADHIIYGRLSTGAADDLVKVKDIARSMMMRYGMEEKLGNLSYQVDPSPFLPTSAAPGRAPIQGRDRQGDRPSGARDPGSSFRRCRRRPAAMDAFSNRGGENRDRLRVPLYLVATSAYTEPILDSSSAWQI